MLELEGLSVEDLEALVSGKGDTTVIPVEGNGVYDLDLISGQLFQLLVHLDNYINSKLEEFVKIIV